MGRPRTVANRLLVAALSALVFGALFLWLLGRLTVPAEPVDGSGTRMTDAERQAAAAATAGPYARPIDPWVGLTLKPDSERELAGARVTTDAYGQRRRAGPEPEPGAARIVLLGDSVAFGFGLADEETIGSRLEEYLAGLAPVGAPRPIVLTVAAPGWTTWNACRYVADHLARLDPDVVLHVPVGNDLHDPFSVDESGRRALFDDAAGAARPHVSYDEWFAHMRASITVTPAAERLRVSRDGGVDRTLAHVVFTGLTPESEHRWSFTAAALAGLEARLAARDARLAVTFFLFEPFEALFQTRVGRDLSDVPFVTTFDEMGASDRLAGDPHPNAAYADAVAWCLAEFLAESGWLPGLEGAELPPLASEFAERRSPARTSDEVAELARAAQELWSSYLGPEIALASGTGFHQIYGGVDVDGMVRRVLWVALANTKPSQVVLEIERLPAESGLYPLELGCYLGDERLGEVEVPAPLPDEALEATYTFPLPFPSPDRLIVLDVEVRASNWVHDEIAGASRTAAFRLVRIGLE